MNQTSITVNLAKFVMENFQTFPVPPEVKVQDWQEVFCHPIFLDASEDRRKEIMYQSSMTSYETEIDYPWDHYYGIDLTPYFQNKVVLDLGCFNGGRGTAWHERYGMASLTGVDVAQEYIDAATQFAQLKQTNAKYVLADAEGLPFEDNSFDSIASYEVFEHLQDVEQMLRECHRVLRPGGLLCVVFPGYYQPASHHLTLVTKLPFLQCLFSGKTLVKAYYEILKERGDDAIWYARSSPELDWWEKGNTINGTTFAKFSKLIKKQDWKIVINSRKPIGSIGRKISKNKLANLISVFLYPLLFIPLVQEVFLHRITFILEKQQNS